MSATLTTISLAGSDMLHLSTCLLRGVHVLNELAFDAHTQNYWLARITPPDMSQRQDAYQSRPRPFQRRYLQVAGGGSRVQYDVHDLSYGFAYEFGGDRVTTDRRIPARIYAVYLGLNGTGTVADFRVYPSAEVAMEAERYMAGHPNMVMAYNSSMKLDGPAPAPAVATPAPSTLMSLPPALFTRMEALYGEMVSRLHAINVLENHLKEAGYKPSLTDNSSNVVQTAILDGREYGETAWTETFLPVVQAEAVRLAEEATARIYAREAQDKPVVAATPVAPPVPASPVAPPASLLDAIVAEQSPAPAPAPAPAKPARHYTKSRVSARARVAAKVEAANATRIPRPSNIPAPTDPNCPF